MKKETPVITLSGKEIPLRFTMRTWEALEDEFGPVEEVYSALSGKGRLRAAPRIAAILSDDPEISADWIFDHMIPADFKGITRAIIAAVTRGLEMETEEDSGEVRDAVLEEIEKKEPKDA